MDKIYIILTPYGFLQGTNEFSISFTLLVGYSIIYLNRSHAEQVAKEKGITNYSIIEISYDFYNESKKINSK